MILIQSDSYDPIYLLSRIDAFVDRFRERMVSMTDDEFEANTEAVALNFLEKNKNLSQETTKYWQVITERSYQFKKWDNIAACMPKIQKNEVVKFFDKFIAQYAPCLRKLCVLVFAQKHMEAFKNSTLTENIKTFYESDIDDFRRSLPLFRVPDKVVMTSWSGLSDDSS